VIIVTTNTKIKPDGGLWSHLDNNNTQRTELSHKRHMHDNGPAGLLSKMYL